jgi:3-oxoadipate enol-lactonase
MSETHQELEVGNARLRFCDEGAGPAVVFIHGWTLDLDMWEPQARELRDSFRIIRYDRRGFGLSSGRPALVDDVTDVLALCERLHLKSISLLGMSQGARIAAQFTARYPQLVSCVIFDGTPSGTVLENEMPGNDIPLARYRELVRAGNLSAFREEWRGHPLTQLRTNDPSSQELLRHILERYRAEDLTAAEAPAQLPPLKAEAIRAPALVISGALEPEHRLRAAEMLARALPSSECAIIPEAAHFANLDNPHAYNTLLRRFIERFVGNQERADAGATGRKQKS